MEKGRNNQKPQWSVVEALLVFIIILSMKRILPFPKMAWFNSLSKNISPGNMLLGQIFWNSLFVAVFFFLLISLILKLKYHLTWREVGLKQGTGKNWLTMGISQGILLFFIMTILVAIISLFFPFKVEEQAIVDIFKTAWGWWERILCLLIVSVFAPFSEELYFRGFLYPAVSKITGALPAVIITSIFL
jgi:membrane protease YdiL (CAAX protease family)